MLFGRFALGGEGTTRTWHKGRLFNLLRTSIFASALICAIVVLGVSAFLNSILEPSELTHFISFALAVSIFTILTTLLTLYLSFRERDHFLLQTRCEVAIFGISGLLWMSLALFMALRAVPEVDCPQDGSASSYTTEEFHAQYHVLEAFAVLCFVLLSGWTLFLLTLAVRHTLAGRKQVWNARVDDAPWFPISGVAAGAGVGAAAKNRAGRRRYGTTRSKNSDSTSSAEKDDGDGFTRLPLPVTAYTREANARLRAVFAPHEQAATAATPVVQRNLSTRTSAPAPPVRARAGTTGGAAPTATRTTPSQPRSPNPASNARPSQPISRTMRMAVEGARPAVPAPITTASRGAGPNHSRSASAPAPVAGPTTRRAAVDPPRSGAGTRGPAPARTREPQRMQSQAQGQSRGLNSSRRQTSDAVKGAASARARGWL